MTLIGFRVAASRKRIEPSDELVIISLPSGNQTSAKTLSSSAISDWTRRPPSLPSFQTLTGSDVPNLDRTVLGTRSQPFPVRTEGHPKDCVDVVLEITQLLTCACVPKFYHLVVAARGDQLSVRAPGDRVDAIPVAQ